MTSQEPVRAALPVARIVIQQRIVLDVLKGILKAVASATVATVTA
jgi:hypothetical protein